MPVCSECTTDRTDSMLCCWCCCCWARSCSCWWICDMFWTMFVSACVDAAVAAAGVVVTGAFTVPEAGSTGG
eukprot:195279-Amphidinium_carterae.1